MTDPEALVYFIIGSATHRTDRRCGEVQVAVHTDGLDNWSVFWYYPAVIFEVDSGDDAAAGGSDTADEHLITEKYLPCSVRKK